MHERTVEVMELEDAGQEEEARDEGAGEELGDAELLQTQVTQPRQGGGGQRGAASIPPCTGMEPACRGSTPTAPMAQFPHVRHIPWPCPGATMGLVAAGTPWWVRDTHCSSVRPVRFLQYMGKSSNWKV